MRGTARIGIARHPRPRITPAYAGNGLEFAVGAGIDGGSPLRMRGTVDLHQSIKSLVGITPAYAGNGFSKTFRAESLKDHPHVCGERHECQVLRDTLLGSPPRMRGTVWKKLCQSKKVGITPAYAGNGDTKIFLDAGMGDHPRVCEVSPF